MATMLSPFLSAVRWKLDVFLLSLNELVVGQVLGSWDFNRKKRLGEKM